jgi:hypothetical protein
MVMVWDGVSSWILITRLRAANSPYSMDSGTYAFAGGRWTTSPAQSLPPSTISGGQAILMAYDSDRNREVLAVGTGMTQAPQGTWEWDGTAWTQISTAHPLPYLSQPSAAYSPDLHAVVLIDPCSSSVDKPAGSTLLYDGTDWRSVSPAHSPPCPTTLAYSRVRHAIVAISFRDTMTWVFDGRDWFPINSGAASAARTAGPPIGNGMDTYSASAAFDVKRDTWVLFGGLESHKSLADTWTGDGTWTRRSSSSPPPARSYAGLVWDPSREAVVLFGGFVGMFGQSPIAFGDTWSWDGGAWRQLG